MSFITISVVGFDAMHPVKGAGSRKSHSKESGATGRRNKVRCALLFLYVTIQAPPTPPRMVAPRDIKEALSSVVGKITNRNYEQSLACFRFWLKIGQAYCQIPYDSGLSDCLLISSEASLR